MGRNEKQRCRFYHELCERVFSFHSCKNISAINGNLDATTISAFWVIGSSFQPLPVQKSNREGVMFYALAMWVKVSQLTCCSNSLEQNRTEHNVLSGELKMPKITVFIWNSQVQRVSSQVGNSLLIWGTCLFSPFSLLQVCTRCRCRKRLSQEKKWEE